MDSSALSFLSCSAVAFALNVASCGFELVPVPGFPKLDGHNAGRQIGHISFQTIVLLGGSSWIKEKLSRKSCVTTVKKHPVIYEFSPSTGLET